MEALERANVVRFARAELKRDLKAGHVLATEVLLSEIPDWLESMPVEKLILSTPHFPRRVYHRLMYAAAAGLGSTVGSLTERQRRVLGDRVGDWELRHWARRAAA
jgi:hypothetical protein